MNLFCVQIEKLSERLSRIAPLMDLYQQGDAAFADRTLAWLDETEKAMSQLHLPAGAELSTLRGKILRSDEDDSLRRSAARRARFAAASAALERAESILRERVQAAEERLRFFEEKLCEGMTAFLLQTPLPARSGSYNAWLSETWQLVQQQQATRPLALYVAASLSPIDRSYILDRVLSRVARPGLEFPEPVTSSA